MIHCALDTNHLSLLGDCAKHLSLTPEETLRRAVARLHVALFQSDADIEDVDFSQSVASLEGPDVQVDCLFEIARRYVEPGNPP